MDVVDIHVFQVCQDEEDPVSAATTGGRWSSDHGPRVLYTSLERDGALAEAAYHWSRNTPRPAASALVHRHKVTSRAMLRLDWDALASLGVSKASYGEPRYGRTQMIGTAAGRLGFEGLIVPSARWDCDNLVLFAENGLLDDRVQSVDVEAIDWQAWARSARLLAD